MNLRPANLKDFDTLYSIGLNTPELRVSGTEPFMDRDDLKQRIGNPEHVFLVAEQEGTIAGFICASAKDADSPLQNRYACLESIHIGLLSKQ